MNKYFYLLPFFFFALTISAQVRYVSASATGNNTGTSWQDAYPNLAFALQNTNTGDIWVAEGTYKPTVDTNRSATFELKPGINLYGGFPAQGNPAWAERDWKAHPTILSGDIGMEGDTSDNTYTIVQTSSSWQYFDIIFDGFEVTGANANYGPAGLDVSGPFNFNTKFTVKNCYFHHNYSGYEAGAISAFKSTLLVSNCLFEENYAGYDSGAIAFFADHFSTDAVEMVCENSIFRNNYAGYEGGVADIRGHSSWYNCIFKDNYADYGGAVFSQNRNGRLRTVNCTFVNNLTQGDGSILDIFSFEDTVIIEASFANCVFATNNGNQLISMGGTVQNVSVTHSLTDDFSFGSGVTFDANTQFSKAPDFVNFDDLHLMPGSPCINAGDNNQLPAGLTMDLDGKTRIHDNIVDLGAYEYGGEVAAQEATMAAALVFPNPASDAIFVKMNDRAPFKSRLVNSQGQTVKSGHSDMISVFKMDVSDLPVGLYLIYLEIGSQIFTEKIIINGS